MDAFQKLKEEAKQLLGIKSEEKVVEEKLKTFPSLSSEELLEILGLTIKSDEENKLATFLCQLSAYSNNSQFNISFNAPSSTGKSYIPLEIGKLFPKEDVLELGYCSPTAFFHDQSKWNSQLGLSVVDLERKILIFLDQPHTLLLQHLRPVLSHDKKEILVKITDRGKRKLRTKNVLIRGFPSVIFCSAGLRLDEQESTRFLLLSPEISQEKIRQSIIEKIKKEANSKAYDIWLEENPKRKELKERIEWIKKAEIKEINIPKELKQTIEMRFLSKYKFLKPRHSRDIARLLSLTKSFALLNLWDRELKERVITCREEDFENALKIWNRISEAQELNLPPYIFELYNKVVLTIWKEREEGITYQEICRKHFEIYGRPLPDWQLRQEVIPMWDMAGLIVKELDPIDKRKILIKPLQIEENYRE